MSEKYGLPYKGSKNKIAERIVGLFPKKKHFYDLFAGGCAVTHCALVNCGFETYLANDIEPMTTTLFRDAVAGKYGGEKRWVSREDFETLKESDAYVRFCWSFGNDGRTYLYSREVEPWKRCVWGLCLGAEFTAKEAQSMLFTRVFGSDRHYQIRFNLDDLQAMIDAPKSENRFKLREIRKDYIDYETGEVIENMAAVSNLRLYYQKRMTSNTRTLRRLERLQSSFKSYDEVEVLPDSVVYCDIPYKGTAGYGNDGDNYGFDHGKFYEWCGRQKELVLVSSYELPASDFVEIASFAHCSILSANKAVEEKVFVPRHQESMYRKAMTKERKPVLTQLEFDFDISA